MQANAVYRRLIVVSIYAGLLTYRESALLYDPKNPSKVSKNRIASVITHEQAHLWFGDLVTCNWWEHTWLNEGFARFFQYFVTAVVILQVQNSCNITAQAWINR